MTPYHVLLTIRYQVDASIQDILDRVSRSGGKINSYERNYLKILKQLQKKLIKAGIHPLS